MTDETPEGPLEPPADLVGADGQPLDWQALRQATLDDLRLHPQWILYRVACACEPEGRWVTTDSPLGPEYVRWLLAWNHADDCPRQKLIHYTFN